ncbi:MAG: flagellar hook-associated protein FlgL [Thiotrichales bacterium]
MRIASDYFARYAALDMNRNNGSIAQIQAQIASGKRLLKPSDGPADAAQVSYLSDATNRIAQHQNNATIAEQKLRTEEETLTGVTNTLQRMREILLGAKSGVQTEGSRFAYKAEAEQLLSQLVSYANTRGADGSYLFSGNKAQTQPFVRIAGAMSYEGDQGQNLVTVGESRQVADVDSGDAVFMRILNGNGTFAVNANPGNLGSGQIYEGGVVDKALHNGGDFALRITAPNSLDIVDRATGMVVQSAIAFAPGQAIQFNGIQVSITGNPQVGDEFDVTASRAESMFSTFDRFLAEMGRDLATPADNTHHQQQLNRVLNDLDRALDHTQQKISSVGARRKFIEDTTAENESVNLLLERARSTIQDTDYAEAISRLEYQMFTLDAVRQSYARIEGRSLFDFLR